MNTDEEVKDYIKATAKSGLQSSLQGHPNKGMWAIKMKDGSYIGGDRYKVFILEPEQIKQVIFDKEL